MHRPCTLIFVFGGLLLSPVKATPEKSWTTSLDAAHCQMIAGSITPDVARHRCMLPGGATMWVRFQDSARWSVGFGTEPNTAVANIPLDQTGRPIEVYGAGIILRLSSLAIENRADHPGDLIVLRYQESGHAACVIGEVAPGLDQEVRARHLLDWADVPCMAMPEFWPRN